MALHLVASVWNTKLDENGEQVDLETLERMAETAKEEAPIHACIEFVHCIGVAKDFKVVDSELLCNIEIEDEYADYPGLTDLKPVVGTYGLLMEDDSYRAVGLSFIGLTKKPATPDTWMKEKE